MPEKSKPTNSNSSTNAEAEETTISQSLTRIDLADDNNKTNLEGECLDIISCIHLLRNVLHIPDDSNCSGDSSPCCSSPLLCKAKEKVKVIISCSRLVKRLYKNYMFRIKRILQMVVIISTEPVDKTKYYGISSLET